MFIFTIFTCSIGRHFSLNVDAFNANSYDLINITNLHIEAISSALYYQLQ